MTKENEKLVKVPNLLPTEHNTEIHTLDPNTDALFRTGTLQRRLDSHRMR